MAATDGDPNARFHPGHRLRLWAVVLLFFVAGDIATTSVGLRFGPTVEVGPLVAPVVRHHGIAAMVALKVAVAGSGYLLSRVVPRPHSTGVPLGLALVGVAVTGWNLALLAVVAA